MKYQTRITPVKDRERPVVDFTDAIMMTKQSFKAECDINNIVSHFQRTGAVTHLAKHGLSYQDISPLDFKTSMDIVAKANTMFEELPSSIRTRFNGDPAEFLAFVQDPANKSEMIELGLAKEQKKPSVSPAPDPEPVPPEPDPAPSS